MRWYARQKRKAILWCFLKASEDQDDGFTVGIYRFGPFGHELKQEYDPSRNDLGVGQNRFLRPRHGQEDLPKPPPLPKLVILNGSEGSGFYCNRGQMFRFAQHDGLGWQGRSLARHTHYRQYFFYQGPAGPFWIPAFAGMTQEKINRIPRPDCFVEDSSQ